jgi:3-deoxy-7-phosphoheptulonate synthase
MIIHLKRNTDKATAERLAQQTQSIIVEKDFFVLITPSALKSLPDNLETFTDSFYVFNDDIQMASKKYLPKVRDVKIGDVTIGGSTNHTLMITGPCSVESEAQIEEVAQFCVKQGVKVLRAGSYKPRTSPYSFQGLGLDGLKLLAKMREKYGLKVITEVKDASHIDEVIEYADIVQIGAKAMYDQGILKKCSKTQKPILIKRGFGSTLQEFVQAAEFVLSGGNDNVMLCERGIRTFETKTRFTLDLCGVAFLKEHTNLPVVLDPSHAMGYSYGVPDLSRACVAMGIDGLLIETHPTPAKALSDAAQQLNFAQFEELLASLKPLANAVGRVMI